jgi:N-methylhydantoinase B/oxoprolinase/acetone carboxylase alpha subunit
VGGYGPPGERAPERVAADVANGYLTAEQAKRYEPKEQR